MILPCLTKGKTCSDQRARSFVISGPASTIMQRAVAPDYWKAAMSHAYLWLILALLALVAELFSGTFYLLVLAIGLLAAAATAGLGLAPEWHFISAAAITLAGWLFLLRRRRQLLSSAPAPLDADAGATVEMLYWQDARHARVRYRGTEWDARLSSRIRPATDCHFEIVRLDGNTLSIRAVEE